MSSPDFLVLQQAAEWFAVLRGQHGEAERLAWQQWLEAHPQNRQAWVRVESISGQFERLPQRQAASTALQARGPGRRQVLKSLAIVGGIGLLGLGGRELPWQRWQANQRTSVGEVTERRLDDGSRLWLNTDTALDVDFTRTRRHMVLYRGEALVELAADARPLWLDTEGARLHVAEGRFSLRQLEDGFRVAVYSGSLEVQGVRLQRLVAGQQAVFDRARIDPPVALRPAQQAWTHGVLQADDMPLGEFVAELSRYQRGHLGCDPRVAGLRLVGAFPLADRERIFAALEASLPVRVVRRLPWWISIEPRAGLPA